MSSTPPSVTLSVQQIPEAVELAPGSNAAEFREGQGLLTVSSPTIPYVSLDDVPLKPHWRAESRLAAYNVDLTNQVGFHRIEVRVGKNRFLYDFQTSTAKSSAEEILLMAETCASHFLGYRRQFQYWAANGERRRVLLPQTQYAWLRDRIDELESLSESINLRPASNLVKRHSLSSSGRRMSIARTTRLLRENHRLLEEHPSGPIEVDGKSFWPSSVIVLQRERTPAKLEHFVIREFLSALIRDCEDLRKIVDVDLAADIAAFSARLRRLASLDVFMDSIGLRHSGNSASYLPSRIEQTDVRYGRFRALRVEYKSEIGPTRSYKDSIRANLKDIWEIYQTFAGHIIGNALGLEYVSADRNLRARDSSGASMRSPNLLLYFDVRPPKEMLASWRDLSGRPADERPDICLVDLATKRHLVIDAKYRTNRTGVRAKQEDLFEMHGYLNSFDVGRGAIVFPGNVADAAVLVGRGNQILELPLRASMIEMLGGIQGVLSYVRAAIQGIMNNPTG